MNKGIFLKAMKQRNALSIQNFTLFSRPTKLINWDNGEEVCFHTVDEAYENAFIGEVPLKQIVSEAETIDDLFSAVGALDDSDIKIISSEEAKKIFGY